VSYPPTVAAPPSRARARLLAAALAAALIVFGLGAAGVLPGGLDWNPVSAQESPSSAQEAEGDQSVADIAEQANRAVVTITTEPAGLDEPSGTAPDGPLPGREFPDEFGPVSTGSGFIFDEEGHILTNSHLVAGADEVTVRFYDGTTAQARVVGHDPFQDVAVLELDLSDGTELPGVAAIGDPETLRAGDPVVAIGSPLGELTNTVSAGIVGAIDRSLDTGAGYHLANLIQHDAPLYPGNSGGPLLNGDGEVVGINVARSLEAIQWGGDGIGFAIEIDDAMEIAEQLLVDGTVDRPYLGINGAPTDEGHLVREIVGDGPAGEAGLEPGDLITAIDGEEIDADNPFINLLFERQPGDEVSLTIERDGDEQTIAVTLGERPADL
jgi:S1-C subfamily serine protease